jgi:hypothetical protein
VSGFTRKGLMSHIGKRLHQKEVKGLMSLIGEHFRRQFHPKGVDKLERRGASPEKG